MKKSTSSKRRVRIAQPGQGRTLVYRMKFPGWFLRLDSIPYTGVTLVRNGVDARYAAHARGKGSLTHMINRFPLVRPKVLEIFPTKEQAECVESGLIVKQGPSLNRVLRKGKDNPDNICHQVGRMLFSAHFGAPQVRFTNDSTRDVIRNGDIDKHVYEWENHLFNACNYKCALLAMYSSIHRFHKGDVHIVTPFSKYVSERHELGRCLSNYLGSNSLTVSYVSIEEKGWRTVGDDELSFEGADCGLSYHAPSRRLDIPAVTKAPDNKPAEVMW